MAQNECPLLRLAQGLILQISEYGHPSTHLNMALTCTTLHHQCRKLLDLHREADAKYRTTSDLCPETVIHLLKDTTKARIERWHVRELEIWGSRKDWEDWRPWVPNRPGTCGLAGGSPTRHGLLLHDIQRYIRTALELWTFPEFEWYSGWEFDSEAVQRDLEAGQDGFLKLLLIATCPRLDSLRFVKRGLDPHTTLGWMAYVINKDSTYTGNWAQGFESLRNVAVGIETDQRMNDESAHRDGVDFAALLYLPNLESLYFNDLHYDRDQENQPYFDLSDHYDFPYSISSVKHIFIDGASGFSPKFYKAIAFVSQNLESLVLRVSTEYGQDLDDVDTFVSRLAVDNTTTLQKLIIYNPNGMHGYRCVNYRPEELDGLQNLKLFTIAASDIELGALHQLYKRPNAEKLADYVSKAFPSSTEAIYIWGSSDVYVDDSKPRSIPSDTLDSALASLIESGVYENLKVIYLADVERRHAQNDTDIALVRRIDAGLKERILQKSVAAGFMTGVHVCTLLNRHDGGYWKNFPARPDRFDLKTDPCYGERPASWRLNLQSGEWGPDCEGCGECTDCLAVYPAELWKSGRS
ncbi:hypothetical protein FPCIR_1170 [Fusarium pseudocircinatum]|uniref:Uncharacterized protein n=1 Tax=Fusarium pseudocircinatum TaxID=56676 RepID=A0A8H5PUZ3_9HYPO|nr:hypothetical protein FPCIR_1170 [Fusarium pseudocircinatum]